MEKMFIANAVLLALSTAAAQESQESCIFKAVGDSATIPLMYPNLMLSDELSWKKNSMAISTRKKNKVVLYSPHNMTEDGSLELSSVQLEDAGWYEAEVYNSAGSRLKYTKAKLCVLERVSKPFLNYSCDENVVLTCHSDRKDGHVMFSWIQNSSIVNGEQESTMNLVGRSGLGNVFSCTVRNNASAESSDSVTVVCEDPSTFFSEGPSDLKSYQNTSSAVSPGHHIFFSPLAQLLQLCIFSLTLTTSI